MNLKGWPGIPWWITRAIGLLSGCLFGAPAVYPPEVQLFGPGAAQTVVAIGTNCRLRVGDTAVAELAGDRVVAKMKGSTWLTATCDSGVSMTPVTVRPPGALARRSYANDVAPVMTAAGCAAGNCHGPAGAGGGFRLSLFGSGAEADYAAIVERIDKRVPDESLLLRKATARTAHEGGLRFDANSEGYAAIIAWIRDGAFYAGKDTPRLTELRVYPREQVLVGAGMQQQLIAVAYYSDGSVRDATRLAEYRASNPDVVRVGGLGEVKAVGMGESAVMVRMGGRAASALVMVAAESSRADFRRVARNNFVDEHVFAKLQRLNSRPPELANDGEFLRRVYLDTIGKLPTEEEARGFLASREGNKRRLVIDWLLQQPEFGVANPDGKPTAELLKQYGPDRASRVFLGVRISCTKCHNHPWERWTRDDYAGFASFFSAGGKAKYLDGEFETSQDRLGALAQWMLRLDNPYFARAIVNRVWKRYMGRGVVEDADDFRSTNPPSNPALLDALAAEYVRSRYDLRRLVRTIALSRAYQSDVRMRPLPVGTLTTVIAQVIGVRAETINPRRDGPPPSREGLCERDARTEESRAAISDEVIRGMLAAEGNIVSRWLSLDRDVADSLYLRTLTRFPTAEERAKLASELAAGDRAVVLRRALEGILRSREFMYSR
ncbi:MAG: DUF1553 domain-containing protein [Acidobacteria bacterium]|nr:DUF1553 domain-containing protein [Acidobacteriota bacterium]